MNIVALSDSDAQRARSHNGIDRTLLVKWLSQIHDYFGVSPAEGVKVTRLVNSLQFAVNGRVFATLRVDTSGLFFREWTQADVPCDHVGLNMVDARALADQSIQQRASDSGGLVIPRR